MWSALSRDFVKIHPQYTGSEGLVEDVVKFFCPYGIKLGGIYQHFKGGKYLVTGVVRDANNWEGDPLVKYIHLEDASLEVTRPLSEFLEEVEREEYRGPRFKLVG